MTLARTFTVLLLAGVAGAACAHRAAPPSVRPALAGRWLLAGSGAKADTGALAVSSTPDLPPPMTTSRPGYADRRESYAARAYDPGAIRAAMEAVRRGDERITIAESDGSVHLEFADGSYFDLPTDGHGQDDIWRGVGRIRSAAWWSDAGLVLERKIEDTSVKVTQTYARPAGSARLTVTTEVKGAAPKPLTLRREYTLAESAAASRAP
ncbi:MAG TPA: hypothetical protein VF832_12215 [Longimicrobiales bacterium]